MKVLYVCRLFTGLEESILQKEWRPTGVPTIYRLIQILDRSDENFRLILTGKERGKNVYTSWKEKKDIELNIKGLRHPVLVLSGETDLPGKTPKFKNHLREIRQACRIIREIIRFQPDLIYCDHSNVWSAGLIARFSKVPVVLRIMGVYPAMYEALYGKRLPDKILRYLYRSPFAFVIITKDGSNISPWVKKALNPKVRTVALINGVNLVNRPRKPDNRLEALPKDKTVVMFLGKLEKYKGCEYFVDTILLLRKELENEIHAVVIGVGNLKEKLLEKVKMAGAEKSFTFIDRILNEQVFEAHERSDIYVSLNFLGNLSNANLEAMRAGACMILLEDDPEQGENLLAAYGNLKSLVWKISRKNIVGELANAIRYLHHHPEERKRRGDTLASVAAKFIPTWEKRIADELAVLGKVAKMNRVSR